MNQHNDKGQKHGYWEHYYFEEVIWYSVNYDNGNMVGCCELFNSFGELTAKAFFL